MVTKFCHNYKLTSGMCLSGSDVSLLDSSFILRIMVIFFVMLQSHIKALIFQIKTFHIRYHKIISRDLTFQVKH